MAKDSTDAPDLGVPPTVFPVALEEFCSRISKSDGRVELIGAFYHVEKLAGRIKDFDDAYSRRLADFANQPA